eukprot:TRINITY_DN14584_c0_g1_i1.p1 TRINITY_DN14584_c0_g1~~TRINITY_DN14584_c0_g1_i1.p1  ORF type:complete len:456 (+),score=37.34 TRINITY_DN14584_c0_g1_i1:75-1442(+)
MNACAAFPFGLRLQWPLLASVIGFNLAQSTLDTELLDVLKTKDNDCQYMISLVAKGANPQVEDSDGWTALSYCSRFDDTAPIKDLLDAKADVNHVAGTGHTPLMIGSMHGHASIVKALLASNADVASLDKDGETATYHAVKAKDAVVIDSLIAARADVQHVNKRGYTALFLSALLGKVDAAKSLLNAGADVNHISGSGWTALAIAVEKGRIVLSNLLVDKGATIDLKVMTVAQGQVKAFIGSARTSRLVKSEGLTDWDDAMRRLLSPETVDTLIEIGSEVRHRLDDMPLEKQVPNALNKELPNLLDGVEVRISNRLELDRLSATGRKMSSLVADFIAEVASVRHWRHRRSISSQDLTLALCGRYNKLLSMGVRKEVDATLCSSAVALDDSMQTMATPARLNLHQMAESAFFTRQEFMWALVATVVVHRIMFRWQRPSPTHVVRQEAKVMTTSEFA